MTPSDFFLPEIRVLGRVPYQEALALQMSLAEAVKAGQSPGAVLILEHPPVITLGANRPLNTVMAAPPGVAVVATKRGGGATAHNPGQLVLYPVLDIRKLGLGVKGFVSAVLDLGTKLLATFGVAAEAKLDPLGLWVKGKKIASLGIHVSRYVATHGLAVNLDNDLSLFSAIVPCGLPDVVMTSVAAETGRGVDMGSAMAAMKGLVATRLAKDVHLSDGEA